MAIKNIRLDLDAYEVLRRAKREGESFSDVVRRLARPHEGLSDFVGLWKDAPPGDLEAFEKWRKESRALDLGRAERLLRRARRP